MSAIVLVLMAFVLTVVACVLSWRRRAQNPAALTGLVVLQAGGLAWVSADIVLAQVDASSPLFVPVSVVRHLGVGACTAGYAVLALALSGGGWAPRLRNWLLLAVEPALIATVILVPGWRALLFVPPPGVIGPYSDPGWTYGPLFALHLAWVNGIVLTCAAVLLVRTAYLPRPVRAAGFLVVCSALPPAVCGALAVTGTATALPGSNLPIMTLGMVVGGLITVLAVAGTSLTVAPGFLRHLVVEEMRDAVVAVTRSGHLADMNRAGAQLVRRLADQQTPAIGQSAPDTLLDLVRDRPTTSTLRLGAQELGLQVDLVRDRRGRPLGTVVVARDTTETNRTARELAERLATIERLQERLEHQATHDDLTGLPNRRHLRTVLESTTGPCVITMIDLDHFKSVNDTWGHLAGDVVLQHAAQVMARHLAGRGTFGRWGGEEFLLITTGADTPAARRTGEALRAAAALAPATIDGAVEPIRWTLSIGIAARAGTESTADTVRRADSAVYQAKRHGRDRVEVLTT